MPEVTARQVIGTNVRRVRLHRGMSQPEFGRLVGEFVTGQREGWSRQTVSALERGDRAFTVDDLLLLAYVLQVPPSALLLMPPDVSAVRVGARTFGAGELGAAGWQRNETTDSLESLAEAIGRLHTRLGDLWQQAADAQDDAATMLTAATRLRLAQAVEVAGADLPEDVEATVRAQQAVKGES